MENPNNDIPTEEPVREDTGASVTTAADLTTSSPPPSTPLSEDTHGNVAPQPSLRRQKNNLARTVLITLLLLVLGAASGIAVYKVYFEPKTTTSSSSTSSTQTTTTSTKTTSLSASALVSALKTRMKATEVPTKIVSGNTIAMTADGKFGAFGITYAKPNGYSFYTTPQTMVGFTVANSSSDITSTDADTVRNYLEEQGLSAVSVSMDDANGIISSADFISSDVRCKVEETSYSYTAGKFQVQVGCADVSSYSANAAAIQPLYKAYIAAHPEYAGAGGLLLMGNDIKSSTVAGYQHVSLMTGGMFAHAGGSAALFYRTPDGVWHYFVNTQDELMCSQYTSSDLKKAYAGEACALPDGSESKVTQ